MPRETVTTFPARLAELREARGLTMQQLAEKAGTSL
jgi:transcriptional regulator with XRE-family HTH domain